MTAEEAVYARLTGDATLVTLAGGRITPDVPEDDTELPFLFYAVDDTEPVTTLAGTTDLARHDLRVVCVAATKDTARPVARRVLARLDQWRDVTAGVGVQGCFYAGRSGSAQTAEDGTEVYAESLSFALWMDPDLGGGGVLLEDGGWLVLEDGGRLILEA